MNSPEPRSESRTPSRETPWHIRVCEVLLTPFLVLWSIVGDMGLLFLRSLAIGGVVGLVARSVLNHLFVWFPHSKAVVLVGFILVVLFGAAYWDKIEKQRKERKKAASESTFP